MSQGGYKSREYIELPSISHFKPINNLVLIHITPSEYERLASGIFLGDVESITDEHRRYEPAEHAVRMGRVVAVPDVFQYTKTPNIGSDWDTEIEIEVGDLVWFSHTDAYNAQLVRCSGEWYYMMRYTNLILAKRGNSIIMLNGYLLADPVYRYIKHPLLIGVIDKELDYSTAIVTHAGKPVRYKSSFYTSNEDIDVGDKVMLANAKAFIWLESDLHLMLDGKKHRVIQRRYVTCKRELPIC